MKQQLEINIEETLLKREEINIKQSSNYILQYQQILTPLSIHEQNSIKKLLIEKSAKQGVKFEENENDSNFSISISEYTLNKQIIKLYVQIENFTFPLLILNISEKSNNHSISCCYSGNFASTFKCYLQNKQIAIKCLHIRVSYQQTIKNVIREYCLCWLASLLNAGPQIERPFGFDIVAYQDCIEFSMQFCEHLFENDSKDNQLQKDLKSCLANLHYLHFIHQDIKPENICYSQSIKKYVFIDYGLSNIITQEFGYKTYTYFKGSFQFCSSQMQDCCITKIPQFIDLYHNDAHAVNLSIIKIKEKTSIKESIQQNKLSSLSDFIVKKFNLIKENIQIIIKFHLFFLHQFTHFNYLKDIFETYKSLIKKQYSTQLLNFMQSLQLNQNLKLFYDILLGEDKKQQKRLILLEYQIKNIYKNIQFQEESDDKQFYKLRYQTLIKINGNNLQFFKFSKEWMRDIMSQQTITQYSKQTYFYMLADQIQINSSALNANSKFKICSVMKTMYPEYFIHQKLQNIQLYKQCVRIIFDDSLTYPVTRMKQQTIYLLTPTIFILQIKTEKQLLNDFVTVYKLPFQILNKLRLIIRYLSSVEWIKQKYYTNYNPKKIQFSLLTLAMQFLQNCRETDAKYTFSINFLSELIKYKLGWNIQIRNNHQVNTLLQRVDDFIGNECLFYYQLLNYESHHQLEVTACNKRQAHLCLIRKFQQFFQNKYQKHKKTFQYYSFLIFQTYQHLQIDSIYKLIYLQYNRIFQQWPNINLFKIEMKYKFSAFMNKYVSYQKIIKEIKRIQIYSNQQYKWKLLQYIANSICISNIKTKNNQIILLQRVYKSQSFIKYLTNRNVQIRQYPLMHKHQLPNLIKIIINIFITIYCLHQINQQIVKSSQVLQQTLLTFINKQSCLQCKFTCFLELSHIHTLKYSAQNKWKQIVEYYYGISQYIIRLSGMKLHVMNFINLIVTICFEHSQLFNIYQPFCLHYQFVKILKTHSFYLAKLDKYSIFVHVYQQLYKSDQFDQIYQLVNQLLNVIAQSNSYIYSMHFYWAIIYFIKICSTNKQEKDLCFQKHRNIINRFKNSKNSNVGIYLIAIIESIAGYQPQTQVFLMICRSLNKINKYGRQIILNRFYAKFIELYSISGRKLVYLTKQAYKYLHIQDIKKYKFKVKINNKQKGTKIFQFQNKFNQIIKNGHSQKQWQNSSTNITAKLTK